MSQPHGGNLSSASQAFGIPLPHWLDLSTGISPWGWPVPDIPEIVWQRLPEEDRKLEASAADYYRCGLQEVLAIPGSQYAISRIPYLWRAGAVALPLWGYCEHQIAWQKAGHKIHYYQTQEELEELLETNCIQHAVVINPSNPTAEITPPDFLRRIAARLASCNGHLIVDEAFIDATPETSLLPYRPSNVLILRSIGKFFGLAGIRLGFLIAEPTLLKSLQNTMDPWAISHPARWLGKKALDDRCWHFKQRERLESGSKNWAEFLGSLFSNHSMKVSPFFVSFSVEVGEGRSLLNAAGRRGVLIRLFDGIDGSTFLRLGLPSEDQQHEAQERLQDAVNSLL